MNVKTGTIAGLYAVRGVSDDFLLEKTASSPGIIANGMEILGIAWGGPTMIMGFMHMAAGTQDAIVAKIIGL
ncbi:MAG: hypothetical protein HYY17_15360 [Planctomycetes bacterium]|nr:hypothetical protein [Planctomycetota bacterium]